MKVAVAVSNAALEREVLAFLRSHDHNLIRRCLDDADVEGLAADVVLYADANFHRRFPRSTLVRSLDDIGLKKAVTTQVIGVLGPHGSPGVSTIALNLAHALQGAVIDAAPTPSISTMTGCIKGSWHGVEIYSPPLASISTLLPQITRPTTVIDFGSSVQVSSDAFQAPWQELQAPSQALQSAALVAVVAAHPISVERYLAEASRYGTHHLVVNLVDSGPLAKTALAMLRQTNLEMTLIPREERGCVNAFVEGKPVSLITPKSHFVKGIKQLADKTFGTVGRE